MSAAFPVTAYAAINALGTTTRDVVANLREGRTGLGACPLELPFAPTFLLLDIHRVLATWIGPPLATGERTAQVGAETIHERWQDGRLMERTFTSTSTTANPAGTITVTYTGYAASNIATHITLRNARLDYQVVIETVPFQ